MSLLKGCLVLLGIALLLISGCFWFLSLGEEEYIATSPVAYESLPDSERNMIPPFAQRVYTGHFVEWQVGEWCFCFDIAPDKEDALRAWCKDVCLGGEPTEAAGYQPLHLTTPDWWNLAPDASLLCSVSGASGGFMSLQVWFSPSLNRVWVMYNH
ncbi:MAG: hypothetical protein Q4A24_10160 [Akkermansia sp.]|nr:hypothetical protein [Akkermansia sp.]